MKNIPDTAVVIIIYLFIFFKDSISVLQLFPFLQAPAIKYEMCNLQF